ncbi:MAG: BtpA/SgcQ family protein [Candidatus Margulisbacteria bacterium]|nr:BtpA/SgcQ family protein [Candidatus Margulisiibacteriota bacterium]
MHKKTIAINQVPIPEGGNFRHDTPTQIIGMLNMPTNIIFQGQPDWLNHLGIPGMTANDWKTVQNIRSIYNELLNEKSPSDVDFQTFDQDFNGILAFKKLERLEYRIQKLSFYKWLEDRMLMEAAAYLKHGVNIMQFENIAAPYQFRNNVLIEDRLLMHTLINSYRKEYPAVPTGIQILCFAENIALELAIRHKLFYVRGESLLFTGHRPEGDTPNSGNQAKFYYIRNLFNGLQEKPNIYPKLYVDLLKKHTSFPQELQDLQLWLDQVEFTKLEGIIITGSETGQPVNEKDLEQARKHLNKVYEKTNQRVPGKGISVPLITGSGANNDNIAMYTKFANAIIVGSYHKQFGYWEFAIDENRLAKFMNAFRQSLK